MNSTKERYARQEIIKGWDQKSLIDGRVLVLGAGTTGNEVVKNLALLGVGSITIVDKDVVEEVNLSRCVLFRSEDIGELKSEVAARRAGELNPLIRVVSKQIDIVYDIGCLEYTRYDCVILCVDNLRARMYVNRYCVWHNVPLIDTGIEGWVGNVFVMTPPFKACLECSWTNKQYKQLGEEHSCSKIGLRFDGRKIPMVVNSAAIVGGFAAQETVKILQRRSSLSSVSKTYWFDGETGAVLTWSQSPKCQCAHYEFIEKNNTPVLFDVNLEETVAEVKEKIRSSLGCADVEIKHDKQIIYSIKCRNCNLSKAILPTVIGKYRRYNCPDCGYLETIPDNYSEELEDGYSIKSLCIPANHMLSVNYENNGSVCYAWINTKM